MRIHGLEHVALMTWARANGFERRWLKRDESFELTNQRGTRLQLLVDSREARVNGLQVWFEPLLRAEERKKEGRTGKRR